MLTENQKKICTLLFELRGMPATLLTKYFYQSFCPTYSNEKYIYSVLKRLIKLGYVTHSPIKYKGKNVSLYYLTSKGLEYIKIQLDISYSQNGNGMLPACDETTYWDIPFEYYKPPLKQTEHYLQLLELLHNFYVFNFEDTYFYTSHYASFRYDHKYKEHKLRPDALVQVKSDKYAIEVDTSSEWHKQLSEKFMKYKHYLEHCEENAIETDLKGILFVMQSDLPVTAYQRRWETVSKSFVEVFGLEHYKLNMFLITRDTLYELLTYLDTLRSYEEEMWQEILKMFSSQGLCMYKYGTDMCVKHNDDSYTLVLRQFNFAFEIKMLYQLFENYHKFYMMQDKKITINNAICEQRGLKLIQGVIKGRSVQKYNGLDKWKLPTQYLKLYLKYRSVEQKIIEI